MITRELFEKYNQFQREFYKTSEYIADILKKKWYDDSEDFSNFHFSYDNENVCFTRSLGFNQYTDGKFPTELLFMTEEEINKWIDDKIEKDRILEERRAKAENDKELDEFVEQYYRREEEHNSRIPELTEKYCKEAIGLIDEDKLEEWNKAVPIRLSDLYLGMELAQTLDICWIMRDESLEYDARLHKAYDLFMDSGHSGMSASLTAAMIKHFCPYGEDVADAVLNLRFEGSDK